MSATMTCSSRVNMYSKSKRCTKHTVSLSVFVTACVYSRSLFTGPIVRIDPNEVSISDLGYIDTIYAPSPGIKRDKSLKGLIGNNKSVGGSVQHDLHRRRREALNPFFSKKSILGLAPQLHEWVSRLGKIFERSMERKGVLNLSDLYFALAGE